MSTSPILTQGFGSFGGVSLVPRLGFGQVPATPTPSPTPSPFPGGMGGGGGVSSHGIGGRVRKPEEYKPPPKSYDVVLDEYDPALETLAAQALLAAEIDAEIALQKQLRIDARRRMIAADDEDIEAILMSLPF